MKKILLVVFLSLFLVACGGPSDEDIINEFYKTLEIPTYVEEDLDLKTTYTFNEKTISAEWLSSDEEVLSNDGKVTKNAFDQSVTLTLKLSLNETTLTFNINLDVAGIGDEGMADLIFKELNMPTEISDHIELPDSITFRGEEYRIYWQSKTRDYISKYGHVTYQDHDVEAILNARITYNGDSFKKDFKLTIKKFDSTDMDKYLNELKFEDEISDNLTLPTKTTINNRDYIIKWDSSNPDIIDSNGIVKQTTTDTNVTLTATMIIDNVEVSKDFKVLVKKANIEAIKNQLIDIYKVPGKINRDIILPTNLVYGLKGIWTSSNTSVISNTGIINKNLNKPTNVDLTLQFTYGGETMTHTFSTSVVTEKHMFIDSTFTGVKENLEINPEGKMVLKEGQLKGTYYSGQIDYQKFSEVVCSWAATSSTHATCELMISLKVDGVWSDYITYSKWGLGLHNASHDQTNSLIKLSTDEVVVLNNKSATGFQYKLIVERDKETTPSCEVSLIALALNLDDYTYDIDKSNLNKSVHYDVPKLYQHDVPGIGGIICSATSSTMLLKYHGHDFSSINSLEHEHIAGLVKDYGNNIYGNWVYNTVGIGAFGEKAYVKRFYGNNEFMYSLQVMGPMACSIRGKVEYISTVTGEARSYTTQGHLLVATGYEITDNGTYIFINDPNARGVSIKVTLENFNKIWRGVSYIVE